jgi:hypothetical protein
MTAATAASADDTIKIWSLIEGKLDAATRQHHDRDDDHDHAVAEGRQTFLPHFEPLAPDRAGPLSTSLRPRRRLTRELYVELWPCRSPYRVSRPL